LCDVVPVGTLNLIEMFQTKLNTALC